MYKVYNIKFINHASVVISNEDCSLMSDPWYSDQVFHKGWRLLHENSPEDILIQLTQIQYIWISHEHPDHFSVGFFMKYLKEIQTKGIIILFQKTSDQRVVNFLKSKGFKVKEIETNQEITLSKNFTIKCIKHGFYDSLLICTVNNNKIVNLNDCDIKSDKDFARIKKNIGECDVLLSQFSYAAWKGGESNITWRRDAAKDKLNTLLLQSKTLKAKFTIPFASYIYFSNSKNRYLNDSANRPSSILEYFENNKSQTKLVVMKPYDIFTGHYIEDNVTKAVSYWEHLFLNTDKLEQDTYEVIDAAILNESFNKYIKRIEKNNSLKTMKLLRTLSPIKIFPLIRIYLTDLNESYEIDIVNQTFHKQKSQQSDIALSSEQLNFIFLNTFGFDTLTVNGCFEESSKNGFSRVAKTLSIENLNNIGLSVSYKLLFKLNIIFLFFSRLFSVERKIKNS